MKLNNFLFLTGAAVALSMSSCSDLDSTIYSGAVSSETKEEVLELNPDMAAASVNAIPSGAYQHLTIYANAHDDFGLPAIMMMLDSNGQDMVSANSGYNWFAPSVALTMGTNTSRQTNIIWYTSYNAINSCNSVLATISEDTEDLKLMFYRAEALSFRAFYYWLISQVYAQNYYGHESDLCVPILTDKNMEAAASEGVPRSTVQEVYDQILADLNEAIDLFTKSKSIVNQVKPDSKPKRFFYLDSAYGMLARVCLTMHDYEGALEAAQNCLNNTTCRPYSIADVSKPTFISLDDSSWLLGQPVTTTDGPVLSGIVNFPSMMGTFSYGYAQYGAWRWCNKKLYDWIPNSDVRKGWWLNADYKSSNLTEAYYQYMDDYGYTDDPNYSDAGTQIQVNTQVKYAPYNYVIDTSDNAADIPYFRIEEVYYILYEAMAMTGNAGGAASQLTNFVRTYRDPSYTCTSSTPEAVQEDIWMQRRVEFWGEGFVAWFDLKRLGKGIDRRGGNYPDVFIYVIEPEAQSFVLPIPQTETTTNKQIPESENNPNWNNPTPVAE